MRLLRGDLVQEHRFHHPAAVIIAGSSGGGKTTFAFNLLYHKHFTKEIRHVHYFGVVGGEELKWHEQLPHLDVTYHGKFIE